MAAFDVIPDLQTVPPSIRNVVSHGSRGIQFGGVTKGDFAWACVRDTVHVWRMGRAPYAKELTVPHALTSVNACDVFVSDDSGVVEIIAAGTENGELVVYDNANKLEMTTELGEPIVIIRVLSPTFLAVVTENGSLYGGRLSLVKETVDCFDVSLTEQSSWLGGWFSTGKKAVRKPLIALDVDFSNGYVWTLSTTELCRRSLKDLSRIGTPISIRNDKSLDDFELVDCVHVNASTALLLLVGAGSSVSLATIDIDSKLTSIVRLSEPLLAPTGSVPKVVHKSLAPALIWLRMSSSEVAAIDLQVSVSDQHDSCPVYEADILFQDTLQSYLSSSRIGGGSQISDIGKCNSANANGPSILTSRGAVLLTRPMGRNAHSYAGTETEHSRLSLRSGDDTDGDVLSAAGRSGVPFGISTTPAHAGCATSLWQIFKSFVEFGKSGTVDAVRSALLTITRAKQTGDEGDVDYAMIFVVISRISAGIASTRSADDLSWADVSHHGSRIGLTGQLLRKQQTHDAWLMFVSSTLFATMYDFAAEVYDGAQTARLEALERTLHELWKDMVHHGQCIAAAISLRRFQEVVEESGTGSPILSPRHDVSLSSNQWRKRVFSHVVAETLSGRHVAAAERSTQRFFHDTLHVFGVLEAVYSTKTLRDVVGDIDLSMLSSAALGDSNAHTTREKLVGSVDLHEFACDLTITMLEGAVQWNEDLVAEKLSGVSRWPTALQVVPLRLSAAASAVLHGEIATLSTLARNLYTTAEEEGDQASAKPYHEMLDTVCTLIHDLGIYQVDRSVVDNVCSDQLCTDILTPLIATRHYAPARDLAERIPHLRTLALLTDRTENSETSDTDVQKYLDRFGVAFAHAMFDHYLEERRYDQLLQSVPHTILRDRLKAYPHLQWLHHVDGGRYGAAATVLHTLAALPYTPQTSKLHAAIGKLAARVAAADVPEMMVGDFDARMDLVHAREAVDERVGEEGGRGGDAGEVESASGMLRWWLRRLEETESDDERLECCEKALSVCAAALQLGESDAAAHVDQCWLSILRSELRTLWNPLGERLHTGHLSPDEMRSAFEDCVFVGMALREALEHSGVQCTVPVLARCLHRLCDTKAVEWYAAVLEGISAPHASDVTPSVHLILMAAEYVAEKYADAAEADEAVQQALQLSAVREAEDAMVDSMCD